MNNARVASILDADMVLVANGGLGSAFDELELNRVMCKEYGVRLRGIILNKVRPDRGEMIETYFRKLLDRWDVPLLGCIPDDDFLGYPALRDIENLFERKLVAGEENRCKLMEGKGGCS